jgi:hypothetical protein
MPPLLTSCPLNQELYHRSLILRSIYQMASLRSRPRTNRKDLLRHQSTLLSREPPTSYYTKVVAHRE